MKKMTKAMLMTALILGSVQWGAHLFMQMNWIPLFLTSM